MPVWYVKIAYPAQTTPFAENLCPSATVALVREGALAEEYAMSSTLVVVESDDHSYGPA